MLKVDHVTASYKTLDGNVVAVEDVNFEIHDNEIFGIAGESGCGKSTMLNVLSSFIPHNERIVTIEDSAELQLQQPMPISPKAVLTGLTAPPCWMPMTN